MQLYKSNHFALTEIRTTGKKRTHGVLCFEGLPSIYGSAKEIMALEDGVVLKAGFNDDIHSREHRQGMIVSITGHNGVVITYGRLACRYVEEGDYVHRGEVIGIEGSTGTGNGEYLTLEFRRNGRRVDGCAYLGIPHETAEFKPPLQPPAEMVSAACELSDKMRVYLDCCPDSEELWRRLAARLTR